MTSPALSHVVPLMHVPAKPAVQLSRAAQRRLQVIEAASSCFTEQGFHGTSMATIAAAAGMSVGHIYHYFDNKNEIIAAIVEHHLAGTRAALTSVLLEPATSQAMIERAEMQLQRAMDGSSTALFVEILSEAHRNPEVQKILQKAELAVHRERVEVLAKALPHINDRAVLEAKAELVAALFSGLNMRAAFKPHLDRSPIPALLRELMREILK